MAMMIKYERHPLATPFPEMAKHDFDELVRSMRDRGYDSAHPIALFDDQILDGWNRWKASRKARVTAIFREFEGTVEDAKDFVYVENLARRHLTKPQKAAALQLMNAELPQRQRLSDASIAERSGLSSTKKVNQIGRVAERDPELAHKVASGEVGGDAAIRQTLREDPAGSEEGQPDKSEEVFFCRNKKLLSQFHEARRKAGATKQSAFNKALSRYTWPRFPNGDALRGHSRELCPLSILGYLGAETAHLAIRNPGVVVG